MAVLEDLGLEVTVEVAQVPAAEYPDPEHDTDNNIGPQTKTNHCFIESRVNQEFHIAAGIKPGGKSPAARWIAKKKRGFSITVAVDGPSRLAGKVLSREHEHVLVKGVVDHAGHTIRHFLFAAVSTVDASDKIRVAKDKQTAKHLGLIRVTIRRCTIGGRSGPSTSAPPRLPQKITLAEKALKGRSVSHGATLSTVSTAYKASTLDTSYVDPPEAPYAVFYFKYRSRDDLKNEMIIPRSREPSLALVDEVEALPAQEVERLARQRLLSQMAQNLGTLFPPGELQRLAREELQHVKGEDGGPAAIKREHGQSTLSRRPLKYARMENGKQAIDLTDD